MQFVRCSRITVPCSCHKGTVLRLVELATPSAISVPMRTCNSLSDEVFWVFDVVDTHLDSNHPATVLLEASEFVRDDWVRMKFYQSKYDGAEYYVEVSPGDDPQA